MMRFQTHYAHANVETISGGAKWEDMSEIAFDWGFITIYKLTVSIGNTIQLRQCEIVAI